MTSQEIAAEINELKPDLTNFWETVKCKRYTDVFDLTNNTSVILFMYELMEIYTRIHPKFYISYRIQKDIKDYREQVNFKSTPVDNIIITQSILDNRTQYSDLISAHVNNFKQYLNPYLYKKFGFIKHGQKSIVKLEENEFSLELFRNSLGKRKLPSTEGIDYFNQIVNFEPELRDKFMDVIFEHCTPSIAFTKDIANSGKFSFNKSTSDKYIFVSRQWVRNIAYDNKILGVYDTFNEQDYSYTPFICGVPRKPTTGLHEVSALFSMISIILMTDHKQKQYIVNCIKEHLSLPEYKSIIAEYTTFLRTQVHTMSNLLEEL